MDSKKIHAIMDWLVPTNVLEVCSFIGLVGYYCHFIKDFSKVAHLITSLQRKCKKYVWLDQCEAKFNALKECLTYEPALAAPNLVGDFMVCTDDSLECVCMVLM